MSAFISYAREDVYAARRLRDDLRRVGVNVWFDEDMLKPGQRWRDELSTAIRKSEYFLPILSTNSVSKRGVVQRELSEAREISMEVPEATSFVIPLRIEPVSPSASWLHELQWVDMFPEWLAGIDRLLSVIKPLKERQEILRIRTSDFQIRWGRRPGQKHDDLISGAGSNIIDGVKDGDTVTIWLSSYKDEQRYLLKRAKEVILKAAVDPYHQEAIYFSKRLRIVDNSGEEV